MNRDNKYALIATIASAVVVVVVLLLCRLSFDTSTLPVPPRPVTELITDEEFVDLYNPAAQVPVAETAAEAYNPIEESNASTPAPQSGLDLANAGEVAPTATTPSATAKPSDVKVAPSPSKEQLAAEENKRKEEEARRKATADLKNAFGNIGGENNTQNSGTTSGNSGSPTGSTSTMQNGHGTGRVNGGWKMPSYAKVPSTVTGSIEFKATINSRGSVIAVDVVGGQAPAATNAALIESCKAEIRRRTFTRSDSNPPETATAYITYRFN